MAKTASLPKTAVVMTTGMNYRGDFPNLDYQVPVEVDAALLPTLLALEGVIEVPSETLAASPAPETPKE